jgi:hypothetical protein
MTMRNGLGGCAAEESSAAKREAARVEQRGVEAIQEIAVQRVLLDETSGQISGQSKKGTVETDLADACQRLFGAWLPATRNAK